MQDMGALLLVLVLAGLIVRVSGVRERAKRRGPASPARFLDFTGKKLAMIKRVHAYSPHE